MKPVVQFALSSMRKAELAYFISLSLFKSLASLLDFTAIFLVGYVASSITMFLTSGSNTDKKISLGDIELEALTSDTLGLAISLLASLFLVKAAVSILITRAITTVVAVAEVRASRLVLEYALSNGPKKMNEFSKEDLTFAIQAGIPAVFSNTLVSITTLVSEGTLFLLVVGLFLYIDPGSTMVLIGMLLLIVTTLQFFMGKRLSAVGKVFATESVNANTALSDIFLTYKELSSSGGLPKLIDRVEESREKATSAFSKQLLLAGMPRHIVEVSVILGIVLLGSMQVSETGLNASAASIGIFLTGSMRIMAALLPWQMALLVIKQNVPLASRALVIAPSRNGRPQNSKADGKKYETQVVNPVSIELENVSFAYGSQRAATNISLSVKQGSQIALIGPSGSGKTTLADLILGLLLPDSGSIRINGIHGEEFRRERLPFQAYVPQRPNLISGTLIENITLGEKSSFVDFDQIQNVIVKAGLLELVKSLPQGLDTDVGKQLNRFSGGQIQRIGIARALYLSPMLLVLDEATSGQDLITQQEISNLIFSLRGKVTVILIAHRLETIKLCDHVYYLDSGEIRASGSFSEVVSQVPSLQREFTSGG